MVINSHFLTLCDQKTRKIKFWDEEFFGMSSYLFENFQDHNPNIFFNFSYGPKLISCLFVLTKPGKLNFWGEEFFGMSSYTCENFQPFILYHFQFHHIMLKRFPGRPKLHFRLFSVFIVVFYNFHSRFWPFS